jgi:hypothetical protein
MIAFEHTTSFLVRSDTMSGGLLQLVKKIFQELEILFLLLVRSIVSFPFYSKFFLDIY